MADNQTDEALNDLPSSKFIYKTLADNGPMTLKGLTEETLLSSRTARYGIDQLEEAGSSIRHRRFTTAARRVTN